MHDVVELETKLFNIVLPASGSIYYADDLNPDTRKVDISEAHLGMQNFAWVLTQGVVGGLASVSIWSLIEGHVSIRSILVFLVLTLGRCRHSSSPPRSRRERACLDPQIRTAPLSISAATQGSLPIREAGSQGSRRLARKILAGRSTSHTSRSGATPCCSAPSGCAAKQYIRLH